MAGYIKELSNQEFERLSSFIFTNYGIKMPLSKKGMLQARLQQRLRETGIDNFRDYCSFVFAGSGNEEEIVHMIDLVSTNKTDFFREPAHFDFMKSTILPEFKLRKKEQLLKVWSSASSSGEEVYSIAITIEEFFRNDDGCNYNILGTDISSRILQKASNAIYHRDRIAPVSMDLRKKYFLKSKNPADPLVRVSKELRDKTRYQRMNLMDASYPVKEQFDIIFCRNVLIYFDRPTQEMVINKLCNHLSPDGYFFLGHSESITGIKVPLIQLKPTIFRKAV